MENLFLLLNFDGGPCWDTFFWHVSGKLQWVWLYLLMLWLMARRVGWRRMLLALGIIVLAVVLSDQIATFFKTYTPRLRPSRTPALEGMVHTVRGYRGGLYGTVSAHAATTCSIALISALILRNHLYTCLIALWALLVAYSRIYLGVHFPLDILLGWVDGAVVGVSGFGVWRWLGGKITTKGSSR